MKINFTKLLALAAMTTMSLSLWAENEQPIPQNMGDYIVLGSATGTENFATYISTKENCTVDANLRDGSNYYTIGTIQNAETATLAIDVTTGAEGAGDYVFGFKTGASNGAASTVNITIQKSGVETPTTIATDEVISTNNNWSPSIPHYFAVNDLDASSVYTITIAATKTGGQYCGNFGQFYFHKSSQYPTMPTDGTTTIDLSGGTYYNSQYNNDGVISGLDNGGYMDNILLNNTTEGYFKLKFNVQDYKAEGTLTATIYNLSSDVAETSNTICVTSTGDKTLAFGNIVTTGMKRIRFDFTGTKTNGTIFNYKNVSFLSYTPASYDALPITGAATLDLNQEGAVFNKCSYEAGNSNIGNVYNGGYADNYYVYNSNSSANYTLYANIPWYKKGGTFTITITDVATNTIEATETSPAITGTGNIHFDITNAITPGLKKIRFDFIKADEEDYLFNLNNVSFTKKSNPTALDNANANTKAVKIIRNGQLVIIRDGVEYNALGSKL